MACRGSRTRFGSMLVAGLKASICLLGGAEGGGLDLLEAKERAPARAGADAHRAPPVLGGLQVLGPEGPGPTLDGASRVDGATDGAVPEHAIAPRILEKAQPMAHAPEVASAELLEGEAQVVGQPLDLHLLHPDKAGRPRAASAAAGAFE